MRIDQRVSKFVTDGFINLFTKRGTTNDRNTHTFFTWKGLFNPQMNLQIYNGDGLGTRIVDIYAGDTTREWIKINEDEDNEILKSMNSIGTKQAMKRAMRWAYATGAGVIYIGVDDGAEDPAEPLNEGSLKSVKFLKVYNRAQVTKDQTLRDTDPFSENFGLQEFYTINPTNGSAFEVHRSRIIEIAGMEADDDTWAANGDFHISIYQKVFDRLAGLNEGYCAASDTLQEYVITVLKMAGLFQHMKTKGGEQEVINRLNILDMSKHSLNSYAIDADSNESIERLSTSLAGFSDVLEKLEDSVAVDAGLPPIVLYSRPSRGLSGNNDNELRMHYDNIHSIQEEKLLEPLIEICRLIQISSEGPTSGQLDLNKTIEFNTLWQETNEEKSKNFKTTAEADAIYIDRGADPDSIIEARYKDQVDITVDDAFAGNEADE
jgi:phage-related protein (TIGR01555 family)